MSKKKLVIVISTYACVLVAVLGVMSYLRGRSLRDYRLAARYSAQEALEETVTAAEHMSLTLQKTPYATDGGMSAKLCSQVYADALAAEAAMSTLPFSTQELEEISAYLNQVGDYAYPVRHGGRDRLYTGTARQADGAGHPCRRPFRLTAQLADAVS